MSDEKVVEFTQRFENRLVTPELAKEWLTHNYEGNRSVRKIYVEQLAEVMRQGRYVSQNGQTIVFGIDDGILYDGQHRLSAVIQADMSMPFGVAYIKDGKEAYKTIDNGTRRQAADFLHVPSKNNCAAVGKFMSCVEWGSAPLLSCLQGKWESRVQVDRGIIITYVEQNAETVVDAVRKGSVMRTATAAYSATLYADFIMLVNFCGMGEEIDEFVKEFTQPSSEFATVNALRMNLMKSYNSTKRPETKIVFGTLLDGYTHFCEMDDSVMFNKHALRLKQYQKYMDATRKSNSDGSHVKKEAEQ